MRATYVYLICGSVYPFEAGEQYPTKAQATTRAREMRKHIRARYWWQAKSRTCGVRIEKHNARDIIHPSRVRSA
jgi:hypothetical protein